MSPLRRKKTTSTKTSKTTKRDTFVVTRRKDNTFFDDEIKQLKLWKSVIEESSECDVLASKESLEQKFNNEKIKYEEKVRRLETKNKQLKRDILINKREISKLEVKLAKLKRGYKAMQLDNDEKEQKIILLEKEIASLSGNGIEKLQNELESINNKVNNLMVEKINATYEHISLKKKYKTFQDFHDQQMKAQFSIEDTIRIQLEKLKQENKKLESLLNSGGSYGVINPSQVINLDAGI
ncbi:26012_t:CDS:2, partial [Racocetra persica]